MCGRARRRSGTTDGSRSCPGAGTGSWGEAIVEDACEFIAWRWTSDSALKCLAMIVAGLAIAGCSPMSYAPADAARDVAIGHLERQSGGGFDQAFSRAVALDAGNSQ